MAAFGACICGFFSGPIGGALAAWGVRRRAASFGYREGAYAGLLASIVATLVFSAIFVPMTIMNSRRIQNEGLNQAERDLVKMMPVITEQQLRDSAAMNSSPPVLIMMVVLNGGLLFVMSVLGGAGIGVMFPRVLQGWTGPPPPPGYRHPYGPPAGVPESYAAPGFEEAAPAPAEPEQPRYSTAWKEVSPEELAKPITLEDDEPAGAEGEPEAEEASSGAPEDPDASEPEAKDPPEA